jgi:hypothetical protein
VRDGEMGLGRGLDSLPSLLVANRYRPFARWYILGEGEGEAAGSTMSWLPFIEGAMSVSPRFHDKPGRRQGQGYQHRLDPCLVRGVDAKRIEREGTYPQSLSGVNYLPAIR